MNEIFLKKRNNSRHRDKGPGCYQMEGGGSEPRGSKQKGQEPRKLQRSAHSLCKEVVCTAQTRQAHCSNWPTLESPQRALRELWSYVSSSEADLGWDPG